MPGAMNWPAVMEDSSFFFQSNSPLELTTRPFLLMGSGTFSATYSLPRVRMILTRPSASKLEGASALSKRAKQRTHRKQLTQAAKRRRGDIGPIQESTALIIDPKKMAG